MKRLSILLAVVLVATMLPMAALAAPGDAVLARDNSEDFDDFIQRAATDGSTLYLWGNKGVYSYRVGDENLTLFEIDQSYADGLNSLVEATREELESQDPEEYVNWNYQQLEFFCDGGKLYVLMSLNEYSQQGGRCDSVTLMEIALADGTATLTPVIEGIDWSDMVEEYDNYSYAPGSEACMAIDGTLYMLCYSNGGYEIHTMDIATGKTDMVEGIPNAFTMAPYKDGKLLIEQYDWNNSTSVTLLTYDPKDESTQKLADITVEEYSPLSCLAYAESTDLIYYVDKGMIVSMTLPDQVIEEVTDMPVSNMSNARNGLILDGAYFVAVGYDATAVRNLDPTLKAETMLRVYNGAYAEAITNAYYAFSNTNSDVAVIIYTDYMEDSKILENMMNRVDTPDIYVLPVQGNAYNAIFNRGFMADMNKSDAIAQCVGQMYEGVQDILVRNGDVVGIPVQCYGNSMGVNEQALEKLGLTLDDVPDNWPDFLDWLMTLPEKYPEDGSVSLMYPDYSARNAKYDLFGMILNGYMNYLDYVGQEKGFNTPELRTILEKLDQVDFVALGQSEEEPYDENGNYIGVARAYDDTDILLETYTGCTLGNMYSSRTPVLLAIDAETPALLPVELYVAFINPFTKNYDAALAYMECLTENLPREVLYSMNPEMNEPVRNSYYEENLKYAQEWLEQAQKQLDEAEEADKQAMEEQLKNAQENYDYVVNDSWSISAEQIEWYRAHAENLAPRRYNALYSGEQSSEIWTILEQYYSGTITPAEMLQQIDKKLQMMILEGN